MKTISSRRRHHYVARKPTIVRDGRCAVVRYCRLLLRLSLLAAVVIAACCSCAPTEQPPTQFVLTTSVNPLGGGSVSLNPSGSTYDSGTSVTVIATASSGYQFVSWSGDAQGTSPTITITMDRDYDLQANFELIPAPAQFVLTTSVNPSGGGSVSPGGTHDSGTSVTVIAMASPGYQFVSWLGDAQDTTQAIRITMDRDYDLQANFRSVPVLRVWWQSPLYDERFVQGETVQFEAAVEAGDGSQLQWISDLDGFLGRGTLVIASDLSVGGHNITVSGYGSSETLPVRVFSDLGELYRSPPAEGEIQRILSDFTFEWVSGSGADEDWSLYDSFNFDQNSTDPSKVVIIAKLDVMRHQRFSEPLPMTNGKTIYDHLRTYVHTIHLYLDCGFNTGGGGGIYLSRSSSVWDGRTSDACKTPFTPPLFLPYIHHLQLFVHEGRHSEPGDPRHTDCGQGGLYSKDQQFEGGSGFAWAAMYYMWVYKYSLYDPPEIRDAAKYEAAWLLSSRFCTTPSHSDPQVQAIIDELLAFAQEQGWLP